jgi:hypothetical protein
VASSAMISCNCSSDNAMFYPILSLIAQNKVD